MTRSEAQDGARHGAPKREPPGAQPRIGPRGWAWLGLLTVLGYAAFAAVQILVLNPRAAAPGRPLEQIRAEVAAAGESLGATTALVILSVGAVLAFAGLAFAYAAPRLRRTPVVLYYLLLLVCGAPGYFFASFSAGMALADTYGISGGDHSPWSFALFATSGAALLTALVIVVVTLAGRLRR
ncbi:hypothetical protein [Brevibacterium album]|uniref:hypothetical protein n=1 Tax=Brevibacterium album TaxID=417948 RepID=UPI00041D2215|nr:hypothetical protein [Brevibacterium album]